MKFVARIDACEIARQNFSRPLLSFVRVRFITPRSGEGEHFSLELSVAALTSTLHLPLAFSAYPSLPFSFVRFALGAIMTSNVQVRLPAAPYLDSVGSVDFNPGFVSGQRSLCRSTAQRERPRILSRCDGSRSDCSRRLSVEIIGTRNFDTITLVTSPAPAHAPISIGIFCHLPSGLLSCSDTSRAFSSR